MCRRSRWLKIEGMGPIIVKNGFSWFPNSNFLRRSARGWTGEFFNPPLITHQSKALGPKMVLGYMRNHEISPFRIFDFS